MQCKHAAKNKCTKLLSHRRRTWTTHLDDAPLADAASAPDHAGSNNLGTAPNPGGMVGLAVDVAPLQYVAIPLLVSRGQIVGNDGVAPPSQQVGRDGGVRPGIVDAGGVFRRAEEVGVDAVLQSLLLFGAAVGDELAADVAVVELVGEAGQDVRTADVDAGVEHVGPDVDLAVGGEEGRREGEGGLAGVGIEQQDAVLVVRVDADHQVVPQRPQGRGSDDLLGGIAGGLGNVPPPDALEQHGHDGRVVLLVPGLVRREDRDDVDVGHDVPAHEDERVALDQVALVELPEGVAGVGAVGVADARHLDAGRPRAVLDVLLDGLGAVDAEHEQLLDPGPGQELDGVVQHGHIVERAQDLGPRLVQGYWAESRGEGVRKYHSLQFLLVLRIGRVIPAAASSSLGHGSGLVGRAIERERVVEKRVRPVRRAAARK